jgi:uncharacterized surface protein with fasciclin (FAS1) repeats
MPMIRSWCGAAATAAILMGGMSQRAGAQAASQSGDLVATLDASSNYKTFTRLLTAANLASTLQGSAQFTVFAPTDAAFAKLPAADLAALEADTTKLKKVLVYHIVPGSISANKVLNLRNARTVGGSKVEFNVREARLRVNDAVIVQPDIKASNGLVHGIDSVLVPK